MKLLHILPLVLACSVPLVASAQWQWIDKDGRKVYSDRSPPPDILEKNILKQPTGAARSTSLPDAPSSASSTPKDGASAPKPPGKDPFLEATKKQRDEEEEAKRRASSEKLAKDKAQNCERARNSLAVLKSGVRMKALSAKGEMEFISDADRASEIERVQGLLTSDCK